MQEGGKIKIYPFNRRTQIAGFENEAALPITYAPVLGFPPLH
jgi:hypothetical protein